MNFSSRINYLLADFYSKYKLFSHHPTNTTQNNFFHLNEIRNFDLVKKVCNAYCITCPPCIRSRVFELCNAYCITGPPYIRQSIFEILGARTFSVHFRDFRCILEIPRGISKILCAFQKTLKLFKIFSSPVIPDFQKISVLFKK